MRGTNQLTLAANEPSKISWGAIFTFVLTWLSLAGLADDFVTWKQWFNEGIMEHVAAQDGRG